MNGSNRRNPGIFGLGLILTLVALYAFVLAEPSSTVAGSPSCEDKVGKENVIAATQDPYRPVPVAAGEANSFDAHSSVLESHKVVAPVSTGINCASCHCDPRGASMKYPAHSTGGDKTNTLSLQEFLKESQYVPLLVRQGPVFCASGHANMPGDEEDNVIDIIKPQGQPGT